MLFRLEPPAFTLSRCVEFSGPFDYRVLTMIHEVHCLGVRRGAFVDVSTLRRLLASSSAAVPSLILTGPDLAVTSCIVSITSPTLCYQPRRHSITYSPTSMDTKQLQYLESLYIFYSSLPTLESTRIHPGALIRNPRYVLSYVNTPSEWSRLRSFAFDSL